MITLKNTARDVIAFELSGTVEKADIQKLQATFTEKMAGTAKIGLLMDMTKWSDITGDAIAEDMKFELSMIPQLNRFSRVAIVSDKLFVKALFKYLKPLVPAIEVRIFAAGEADKALTFVSDTPALKAA